MITIHLYYTGNDGSALLFIQEMEESGIALRIRNQEGNLGYDYYQSIENPETVLLVDKWKDQAALDTHHASLMMQEILQLRNKYQLTVRAERYLIDSEGMSEHDLKFLNAHE